MLGNCFKNNVYFSGYKTHAIINCNYTISKAPTMMLTPRSSTIKSHKNIGDIII